MRFLNLLTGSTTQSFATLSANYADFKDIFLSYTTFSLNFNLNRLLLNIDEISV